MKRNTCECGCGGKVSDGKRFILRHNLRVQRKSQANSIPWNKGKKLSKEHIKKLSDAKKNKDHSVFINAGIDTRFKKGHKINICRIQTEKHKKKNGDANRGNKSPNWKGGYSRSDYGIGFNVDLREEIRNKYNNKCFECGKLEVNMNHKLNVHHINYNKKCNSLNNLIPLCKSCHSKTNFRRKYWENYFKKKIGNT